MRVILTLLVLLGMQSYGSPIAKLAGLTGKAFVLRDGNQVPAKRKMDLFEGDQFVTAKGSFGCIQFGDGSRMIVKTQSSIKISQHRTEKAKDGGTMLRSVSEVIRGVVAFDVKTENGKEKDIHVRARTSVMGVRGTAFMVGVNRKDKIDLFVTKGQVVVADISAPETVVPVSANQMVTVDIGSRSRIQVKEIPNEIRESVNTNVEELPEDTVQSGELSKEMPELPVVPVDTIERKELINPRIARLHLRRLKMEDQTEQAEEVSPYIEVWQEPWLQVGLYGVTTRQESETYASPMTSLIFNQELGRMLSLDHHLSISSIRIKGKTVGRFMYQPRFAFLAGQFISFDLGPSFQFWGGDGAFEVGSGAGFSIAEGYFPEPIDSLRIFYDYIRFEKEKYQSFGVGFSFVFF